jgi:hypothetical protein
MKARVLLVESSVSDSPARLVEQMRMMKRAREESGYDHVVCCIRGFDEDPRELYEIPDVIRYSFLNLAGALDRSAQPGERTVDKLIVGDSRRLPSRNRSNRSERLKDTGSKKAIDGQRVWGKSHPRANSLTTGGSTMQDNMRVPRLWSRRFIRSNA